MNDGFSQYFVQYIKKYVKPNKSVEFNVTFSGATQHIKQIYRSNAELWQEVQNI